MVQHRFLVKTLVFRADSSGTLLMLYVCIVVVAGFSWLVLELLMLLQELTKFTPPPPHFLSLFPQVCSVSEGGSEMPRAYPNQE